MTNQPLIGKVIHGTRYFHKSVLSIPNQLSFSEANLIQDALDFLNRNQAATPPFNIVAINQTKKHITLALSPDWDNNPEPTISTLTTVNLATGKSLTIEHKKNPPVIHSKFTMVHQPTYDGFDVDEAIKRSNEVAALHPNPQRMNRNSYWTAFKLEKKI